MLNPKTHCVKANAIVLESWDTDQCRDKKINLILWDCVPHILTDEQTEDKRLKQCVWGFTFFWNRILLKLGCFKNVGVYIDTSRGEDASSNGLEITFTVKELKRVLGGITTLVGNNEGSLVIKSNLPNTFGRGENLQVEYTYGTKQSKGFNGMFIKPLHNKANTM